MKDVKFIPKDEHFSEKDSVVYWSGTTNSEKKYGNRTSPPGPECFGLNLPSQLVIGYRWLAFVNQFPKNLKNLIQKHSQKNLSRITVSSLPLVSYAAAIHQFFEEFFVSRTVPTDKHEKSETVVCS